MRTTGLLGTRLGASLLVLTAACSSPDTGGGGDDASVPDLSVALDAAVLPDAGRADLAMSLPRDLAASPAEDAGRAAYCMGKGPPIIVGDSNGGGGTCGDKIAAVAFRYGLCACQGLVTGAPITTDAFDSRMMGMIAPGNGGSIGLNGSVNAQKIAVGGSLWVMGTATVNSLSTGVDLFTADRVATDRLDVGRDAQINGDVFANFDLRVKGTLTLPPGRTATAPMTSIGKTVRAAVNLTPPCDCDPKSLFDISGYVAGRRADNDNAAVSLDPARLANYMGAQTLDLPCGRFFLDRIGGNGAITLKINARTALFIGGDVNLSGGLRVDLGPDGELDLFIDGELVSAQPLDLGNKATPARVRVYVGGVHNINLSANSVLAGNLYAPQSALVTSGPLEVWGALFVRSFNASADVKIHHDIAIVRGGDDCPPPLGDGGMGCGSCRHCGGQACKNGVCGGCVVDADCCAPLVCGGNGQCIFAIQ